MCSSDARQVADKVPGDYSRQYEAVCEPNSWDFEVPLPQADLDTTGEGFAMNCSDDETLKLIEDSTVTVGHIVNMLLVDMFVG
jgi:hypothetical protein